MNGLLARCCAQTEFVWNLDDLYGHSNEFAALKTFRGCSFEELRAVAQPTSTHVTSVIFTVSQSDSAIGKCWPSTTNGVRIFGPRTDAFKLLGELC